MNPEADTPGAGGTVRRPHDVDELIDADLVEERGAPSPEAEANADALNVSDGLRSRIRAMERSGCAQPFGERIALIGAAELDGKRPVAQRSGAYKLLSAVYARGRPHWSDPVRAIAPLRELLFKEDAPPNADRGLFYLLTRAAEAGISPSAFAVHLILPRMGRDADWRRWRSRHIWVLDAVLDILIDLKAGPPWNQERLAGGAALTDVALCKYVGRPLSRLSGSLIEGQGVPLKAWAESWKSMRLGSRRFILYMRATILPAFYRLSGKIDPEQLAPIGRTLAMLERALSPRLDAMDEPSFRALLSLGGFAATFGTRSSVRAGGQAPFFDLVRELRAYLEAALTLAGQDAGPALLPYLDRISLGRDAGFMADAASALAALPSLEGGAASRWHLGALAASAASERERFIMELRQAGGAHPSYPWRRPVSRAARFAFEATGIAAAMRGEGPRLPSDRRLLNPTVDFSSLRPSHADAIRAAKAPLALERLCAGLTELASRPASDADPLAAAAYATLGREWKRLRAAGPEAEGAATNAIAILNAAFGLIEALPAKAGSALRVAAAILASSRAMPSGERPGLSLLGSALSQLRACDGYPKGLETILKAIRAEYVPGYLGISCASLALQCVERIAGLWAWMTLRAELAVPAPESWGELVAMAGGAATASYPEARGRTWSIVRDGLLDCVDYPRLRAELAALRDLAAKNIDTSRAARPPERFLRVPLVASDELYPDRAEPPAEDEAGALELRSDDGGLLALASLQEPDGETLGIARIRVDPELALSAGNRDMARLYMALRELATLRASGRRIAIPVAPDAISGDPILADLVARLEREAGARPSMIGGSLFYIHPGK